jgi:hypothetical protein
LTGGGNKGGANFGTVIQFDMLKAYADRRFRHRQQQFEQYDRCDARRAFLPFRCALEQFCRQFQLHAVLALPGRPAHVDRSFLGHITGEIVWDRCLQAPSPSGNQQTGDYWHSRSK